MQHIEGWGVDRDASQRPGVPAELSPEPVVGTRPPLPEQQPRSVPITCRSGVPITPVFGTAQPPHGLSGKLRRIAYEVPEWRARHWLLLLLADRVDVVESAIERLLGKSAPTADVPHPTRLNPTPPPAVWEVERPQLRWDVVDEASWESFPASDPPGRGVT